MSDLSLIVLAIPALGALAITITAQRPARRKAPNEALLDPARANATDGQTNEASRFRALANLFAVGALVAVAGLTFLSQSFHSPSAVGGNACSAAFALLTCAVWLPAIYVARRSDHERPALLYGLLLLLESSYLAIFVCDHAIWLCVALMTNSVLLYLLTAGWSEPDGEGLAQKVLFVNLGADLLILIGLLGLVIAAARVSTSEPGTAPTLTYSLSEILRDFPRIVTDDVAAQEYWKHAQRSLLSILILGAALKTPLVPFHAWFASVVANGPLCVGIAVVGSGLRVGLFLLARFIGPLSGDLGGVADLIVGLTVLGAFLEALLTYGQADWKKMIACVSLLQASLAVAGFFSTRAENASGPLMLALSSGVAATLVLFAIGFLDLRYGTRDLTNVGGFVHKLPNLAAVLLLASLSLVGIPGLFGFPGLFSTLGWLFGGEWTFAFLAIGSCLIGPWAILSMLQHLVFGALRLPVPAEGDVLINSAGASAESIGENDLPGANIEGASPREWSIVNEGKSGSIDLGAKELLLISPLLASLVALGIWPQALAAALRFALLGASLSP